jgi:GNAT superfamily N-acetyltransferase
MIRKLGIHDLPRCEVTALAFYSSSKFLEKFETERFSAIWKTLLENGSGVIFAYEHENCIVGALGGIVHQDIYGPSIIAEEFFWFVEEEYRGAGLLLYHEFEEWAVSRGADTIQMVHLLDLMPEKVGAFYRRQGYHPIETRYSKKLR